MIKKKYWKLFYNFLQRVSVPAYQLVSMLFLSLIVLETILKKKIFLLRNKAQTRNEIPLRALEFLEYDSRPREDLAFTLELHCEMRARARVLQIGGGCWGGLGVCVRGSCASWRGRRTLLSHRTSSSLFQPEPLKTPGLQYCFSTSSKSRNCPFKAA